MNTKEQECERAYERLEKAAYGKDYSSSYDSVNIDDDKAKFFDKLQEYVDDYAPAKEVIEDGNKFSTCNKVQYTCPHCNQIMLRQVCITKHKPNYCYKCGGKIKFRGNR